MKNVKILVALMASIAAIAIGQRHQQEQRQNDTRTQKAQVKGFGSEAESWFV